MLIWFEYTAWQNGCL